MFVDNIRIFARAGKGGNGLVSFRRAKFVPKGGPDGGDGGDGGSVILEVDPHTNDLRSFFYDPKLIATDGVGGQSAKKHGKNGKSVIGKVPPGTIIYRSNASSMAEATWLEREGEGIELEKIADLTEIGTRFTLCQASAARETGISVPRPTRRLRKPRWERKGRKASSLWNCAALRTPGW